MLPNVGTWEILIILVVVFLVFGANRLPDAAKGLGRGLREFKKEIRGITELTDDVKNAGDTPQSNTPPENNRTSQNTDNAGNSGNSGNGTAV